MTTMSGRVRSMRSCQRVKAPAIPYCAATFRTDASSRWHTPTTVEPLARKARMWARPMPSPMMPTVWEFFTVSYSLPLVVRGSVRESGYRSAARATAGSLAARPRAQVTSGSTKTTSASDPTSNSVDIAATFGSA